jgi:DNA-binding NarL/FixJ family response regulator
VAAVAGTDDRGIVRDQISALLNHAADLIEAGATGVITHDQGGAQLVDAMRAFAGSAGRTQRVAAAPPARKPMRTTVRMTPREREVVALIGEGLSNREISDRLGIAVWTVRNHVRNVMDKLMLHTRLQIAAFVHREAIAA